MKIIHIMKKQKFTAGVCEFYDMYFNNGEHEICFLNNLGEDTLIRQDISLPQREVYFSSNPVKNILSFARTIKGFDHIVFHSYFYPYWLKIFLAMIPRIYSKIVWIEWGGDLYSWKSGKKTILHKIKDSMEKVLRTKCSTVVCIFPPDCDCYRKEFPESKANVFYAPYCSATVAQEFYNYCDHARLSESREKGETIYIQIGHSATPAIDHMGTLNALRRFADKDIRILMPLSYGDVVYADNIQKYAEELFPGKVICLRKMLPQEEYFKLLERVDIAVFQTFRQIALGNIRRMMFRNVKIYMPQESVMFREFEKLGVPVQRTEDLKDCSFEEFTSDMVIRNKELFDRFIESYTDMEGKVALWRTVYDDLRERFSD